MALTVIQQPDALNKLYSPNIYVINETSTHTSVLFDITLTYDTIVDNVLIRKVSVGTTTQIDIQSTLQNFYDYLVNTSTINNTILITQEHLLKYDITIKTYNSNTLVNSTTISNKRLLNGCKQYNETFDYTEYVYSGGVDKVRTFTNYYDINREVLITNNSLSLSYYDDGINNITGIDVEVVNRDGSTTTEGIILPSPLSQPMITYLNISPIVLNTILINKIDEDTRYYIIKSNRFEDFRVNVLRNDVRFSSYTLIWLNNEYGTNDEFTFTKNSDNTYRISRDNYTTIDNNYNKEKYYNIEIEHEIDIVSGFICHMDSERIKNLWYSSNIIHNDTINNQQRSIIVNDRSIKVLKRLGGDNRHELSFKYSNEFITQKR